MKKYRLKKWLQNTLLVIFMIITVTIPAAIDGTAPLSIAFELSIVNIIIFYVLVKYGQWED